MLDLALVERDTCEGELVELKSWLVVEVEDTAFDDVTDIIGEVEGDELANENAGLDVDEEKLPED